MEQKLLTLVKQKYDKITSQPIFKDKIIGTFIIWKEPDKLFTISYYIPSIAELYILDFEDFSQYCKPTDIIIDIRYLYEYIHKQDNLVLESLSSQNRYINPIYQSIFDTNILLQDNLSNTQQMIYNIIHLDNKQKSKEEIFFKNLTALEEKALKYICNTLDTTNNPYLIISQLVMNSNISRPVFTTLLNKIKHFDIGTVERKGVKGTYVAFQNYTLLKDLFEK